MSYLFPKLIWPTAFRIQFPWCILKCTQLTHLQSFASNFFSFFLFFWWLCMKSKRFFWWLCVWSKRFHSAFMAHKGREASLGIECCLFLVGPLQSCAMLQITPIGFIPELCFQDWSLECTEVGAKCDRQGFSDKFPLFLLSSVKTLLDKVNCTFEGQARRSWTTFTLAIEWFRSMIPPDGFLWQ